MLQGETNRAMEQNIKSRNRCGHNGHLIFGYNGTAAQCRKDELFNKWYWSNWILTWGIKWNWIPTLHKSIPGSVKTYMLKLKTRKLLEENTKKSSLPWGSRKFLKQALLKKVSSHWNPKPPFTRRHQSEKPSQSRR